MHASSSHPHLHKEQDLAKCHAGRRASWLGHYTKATQKHTLNIACFNDVPVEIVGVLGVRTIICLDTQDSNYTFPWTFGYGTLSKFIIIIIDLMICFPYMRSILITQHAISLSLLGKSVHVVRGHRWVGSFFRNIMMSIIVNSQLKMTFFNYNVIAIIIVLFRATHR